MLTVYDVILCTNWECVEKEFSYYYGKEYLIRAKKVYDQLAMSEEKQNVSSTKLFIRVLKENESGIDVVVQDYDIDDTNLMFDVCAEDNTFDGLYSIASADYGELLSYYVEEDTLTQFSYAKIMAHILFNLDW